MATITDTVGSATLTIAGNPTFLVNPSPILVDGELAGGYGFDGVVDCAVAGATTHQFLGTLPFSVSGWAKLIRAPYTNEFGRIWSCSVFSSFSKGWALLILNTGAVQATRHSGTGTGDTFLSGTGVLSTTAFRHLAVTYDSTTLKIYLDGLQDATGGSTVSIGSHSGTFTLAKYGSGAFAAVELRGVGVCDAALSPADVRRQYEWGSRVLPTVEAPRRTPARGRRAA